MGEFLNIPGWNDGDEEAEAFEGKLLTPDEYRAIVDACRDSGANEEQTYALVQKYEQARLHEIMLEMFFSNQIKINKWNGNEPLYSSPDEKGEEPEDPYGIFSRN